MRAPETQTKPSSAKTTPRTSAVELVNLLSDQGFVFLASPVHLLVADKQQRVQSPSFASHVRSSTLPTGSVIFATKDVAVCSPELCFVQMATTLSFPKLVELGFELCGTYGIRVEGKGGFEKRHPLTSTKRIAHFLELACSMHGSRIAKRALTHIVDGSASPMETIVTMLLCLPQQLGGYGFALPELNFKTSMGAMAREATIKDFYRCDLYWPKQKVSVEYDRKMHHSEEIKRSHDFHRANALRAKGIEVITIAPYQVFRYDLFDDSASMLAKCLGRRMRKSQIDWTPKRMELRRELLDPLRGPLCEP